MDRTDVGLRRASEFGCGCVRDHARSCPVDGKYPDALRCVSEFYHDVQYLPQHTRALVRAVVYLALYPTRMYARLNYP